jgi:hypothetical protein
MKGLRQSAFFHLAGIEPHRRLGRITGLNLSEMLINSQVELLGADVAEPVPLPYGRVNEMVAARLICRILAYWFSSHHQ